MPTVTSLQSLHKLRQEMNNWIRLTVKQLWNYAMHVLYKFWVKHKHKGFLLGPMKPSFHTTRELYSSGQWIQTQLKAFRLVLHWIRLLCLLSSFIFKTLFNGRVLDTFESWLCRRLQLPAAFPSSEQLTWNLKKVKIKFSNWKHFLQDNNFENWSQLANCNYFDIYYFTFKVFANFFSFCHLLRRC